VWVFTLAPRVRHPYYNILCCHDQKDIKGFSIALFVSRSLCVIISENNVSAYLDFSFYLSVQSRNDTIIIILIIKRLHILNFILFFIFQLCCKKYQNGQHVQPDIGLLSRSSCTHHRWYRVYGQGVGREIATLVSKHRMYIPINQAQTRPRCQV